MLRKLTNFSASPKRAVNDLLEVKVQSVLVLIDFLPEWHNGYTSISGIAFTLETSSTREVI